MKDNLLPTIVHAILAIPAYFCSFMQTVYFNFHYFPFKVAVKFPVFVSFRNRTYYGGHVILNAKVIKTGMIKLGHSTYNYYRRGMSYMNDGTLILGTNVMISNESKIYIKKNGILKIGNNVGISSTRFLVAYYTHIGDNTLIGIDSDICDCDFHMVRDDISGKYGKPYKKVVIGTNNWLGMETLVMKGTRTPDDCTVSARSVLNQNYKYNPHCLIGGNPATLLDEGYSRAESGHWYTNYPTWEQDIKAVNEEALRQLIC